MKNTKKLTIEQTKILKTFVSVALKNKHLPSQLDMKGAGYSRETIRRTFGNLAGLKSLALKIHSKELEGIKEKTNPAKDKALNTFIKVFLKKGMTPTLSELKEAGLNKEMVKHHFGNLIKLKKEAREKYPQHFLNTVDESIFTEENLEKTQKEIKKYKKFVITTAVTGMSVHEGFLKSLKLYCKENEAKLLILPTTDPAATAGFELDSRLAGESVVVQDTDLNSNIYISTFKTSAKQINTLTGLKRMGKREKSTIVAGTKFFLEFVPIANDSTVHALMTTASCTLPEYQTERYMSQRTAFIAQMDHKIGAIVVEIENDKIFHFRQIQASANGSFFDNNKHYNGKITQTRADSMTLGDIHVGFTSKDVMKANDEQIAFFKPKVVFNHDLFDGTSVSHHIAHSFLTKAGFTPDQLSLEQELRMVKDYLEGMKKKHPYVEEWVIVRSNHDDFIDRYLESGRYVEDSINSLIAHRIAIKKLEGETIGLRAGLELVETDLSKITFLGINDSYKISGIENGVHGHLGLNGQRNPGNSSLEIAYGAITAGHSHSAGILRDVFRTGTCTDKRIGYNNGASSWTNTNCVQYPGGARQLINTINGKWKA